MEKDINVVFFDLFFTLITPNYSDSRNENDVLGITREEWERYSESDEIYIKRATSKNMSSEQIIEDIINKMKIDASERVKKEILNLRKRRLEKSLINVDPIILEVLLNLKRSGKKTA